MNKDEYLNILNKLKHLPDTNSDKLKRVAGIITDYVKEIYDIDLTVVGGLSVDIPHKILISLGLTTKKSCRH